MTKNRQYTIKEIRQLAKVILTLIELHSYRMARYAEDPCPCR